MNNETMPYFEIITEMTEYLTKHYDVQENMIFELIKSGSWEIALKKGGHDEIELRKTSTYTIDQAMQLFKNHGTYEDYKELIDYIIMAFPHIGIHDLEKEKTKIALMKIIRKHMHHGDIATITGSDNDCIFDAGAEPESESRDTSSTQGTSSNRIPNNAILTGKNVYGGLFLAQLPYIKEHFEKSGANDLMKKMIKNGYKGPTTIREINRSAKYPIQYLCIYNKTFIDLFGEEHFEKMARNSAKRKGVVGVFVRWAGTPRVVIKKSPEYWQKFCDFGRLESKLKEEDRGVLRLLDGRVKSLFCKYLTNYFMGVGEAINYKVAVRHTECVFKGSDHCEWEITWGNIKTGTPPIKENSGIENESLTKESSITSQELVNTVTSELEIHLGDILARGITKKALDKIGSAESMVTISEMRLALTTHIKSSLLTFMSPGKASDCVSQIDKKISSSD